MKVELKMEITTDMEISLEDYFDYISFCYFTPKSEKELEVYKCRENTMTWRDYFKKYGRDSFKITKETINEYVEATFYDFGITISNEDDPWDDYDNPPERDYTLDRTNLQDIVEYFTKEVEQFFNIKL